PELKLGVCGEHGGDPDSIDFLHHSGIDYVSCSPYRVPIARGAPARPDIRAQTRAASRSKRVAARPTAWRSPTAARQSRGARTGRSPARFPARGAHGRRALTAKAPAARP